MKLKIECAKAEIVLKDVDALVQSVQGVRIKSDSGVIQFQPVDKHGQGVVKSQHDMVKKEDQLAGETSSQKVMAVEPLVQPKMEVEVEVVSPKLPPSQNLAKTVVAEQPTYNIEKKPPHERPIPHWDILRHNRWFVYNPIEAYDKKVHPYKFTLEQHAIHQDLMDGAKKMLCGSDEDIDLVITQFVLLCQKLVSIGGDINDVRREDDGHAMINLAVMYGNAAFVDLLCRQGADTEILSWSGWMPLHDAAEFNQPDVLFIFLFNPILHA